MCLPLTLTIITGTAYPILDGWLSLHKVSGFILKIHSGSVFGLDAIYPIFNGLGLMGLLITGLSMTSLFSKKGAIAEVPVGQLELEKKRMKN